MQNCLKRRIFTISRFASTLCSQHELFLEIGWRFLMFLVRSHFVVRFGRLFFVFLDCRKCKPLFLLCRRLFFPMLFGLFHLLVDLRWLHLPFLFCFQFLPAHLRLWKYNLLVHFLLRIYSHFRLLRLRFQFHRLLLLF